MGFFRKRKLGPTERLENELTDKQRLRQDLARRLNTAEMFIVDKREASERLALDGASDKVLGRAEERTRVAEDRARTLRAALTQLEDQIGEIERELGAAVERRYRETVADTLEAMVAAIAQTAPPYEAAAATLVEAVTRSAGAVPEATAFAADLDAVRREVSSAVALICSELRAAAARARSGEAKIAFRAASESEVLALPMDQTATLANPVDAPRTVDVSSASRELLNAGIVQQMVIRDLFGEEQAKPAEERAKAVKNDTAAAA